MDLQEIKNKKSLFWILQASGWMSLGIIYIALYYRENIGSFRSMIAILLTYITGFIVSLFLRLFYRKIRYQSQSISKLSVIVVISSVISAILWFWLDVLLSLPINKTGWYEEYITLQRILSEIFWHSFIMGTWSALYFVIKLWMEWNLQKDRAERANALAQSAQLQMLRYQLNPHFLFNALNSIRALVDEDKKNAKSMITELSEFLRYSLISKNYSNVPLQQELKAIRHYFRIEKKRYEEKLEVNFDIDPVAEEYPVLSFLIHPLVENAVKFGMQTSTMPLKINVIARVIENKLKLEVSNSGKWIESLEQNKNGTGTGLKNIRQRLENAFPQKHSFEIIKDNENVRVLLEIYKNLKQSDEK
jgi:LytS/YehU family sensor histidine kinase